MRIKQWVFVGGLLAVGMFGLPVVVRAQPVIVPQPVQMIGPLYAYGPSAAPADPAYRRRSRSPYSYITPDVRSPPWYAGSRARGYRGYRPYPNYAYRAAPFAGRYRYSYRYDQRYLSDYGPRHQYAARIIAPGWNGGFQQVIGPAYRIQPQ